MSNPLELRAVRGLIRLFQRPFFYRVVVRSLQRLELWFWWARGAAGQPPPLAKRRRLVELARRHRLRVFVETGTYLGDTALELSHVVDRVVSTELDERLYRRASLRFADDPSVTVIHGDSAERLPDVLAPLDEPALFWLDAHYSGHITARGEKATPLVDELAAALAHHVTGHVIVVDDVHCLDGTNDYPTVERIRGLVHDRGSTRAVVVEHGVLLVLSPRARDVRPRRVHSPVT